MSWTPITEVTAGDYVQTSFGKGNVEQVSGNGTARVNVGGQRYEVPVSEITEKYEEGKEAPMPPEEKQPNPVFPWSVKKGDRVQTKTGKDKGTVTEVTQRTVKVAFDDGGNDKYNKKEVASYLEQAQDEEIKVGDKVKLLRRSGGAPKVGEIGTVKRVMGSSLTVDFPSQKGYSTSTDKVEKVGDEMPKEDEFKFKPGDKVRVVHSGVGYTAYNYGAEMLGATKWKVHENVKNGDEGVVVNSVKHHQSKKIKIVLIEHDGQEYIIGETGLELIEPAEQPKEEANPSENPVTKTGDGLHELFQLKGYLEKKIDEDVTGELGELREAIKAKQTLEVKVGDKTGEVKGLKHKQLEQLINYAALRLSPLLVGMAGTGKTHAGEQVADALGLKFYAMSVGAQTSKSDIIGYMAANGQYVPTHFREAYENGGVFLMDEIDAGNANVLIQINAALSNNLCAFPDAMVKRHEDFVFIASANTFGNGANRQYVGRNQLDAATLDRFAVIEWFIDDDIESQLTTGVNGKAWYMAVRAARDYVAEKSIRALISPRATQKGSKLLHIGQPLEEVIHATMLGSVPEDKKKDVQQVATQIFEKFASEVPGQLPKSVNPEVDGIFKAPF